MKPGDICLLRGGHVLRYQGLWGNRGPCLAFRSPEEGLCDPPVGASVGTEDVLRVLSEADVPWLRERHAQLTARGLSGIEHVITELCT